MLNGGVCIVVLIFCGVFDSNDSDGHATALELSDKGFEPPELSLFEFLEVIPHEYVNLAVKMLW